MAKIISREAFVKLPNEGYLDFMPLKNAKYIGIDVYKNGIIVIFPKKYKVMANRELGIYRLVPKKEMV